MSASLLLGSAVLCICIVKLIWSRERLNHIPTVGPAAPLLSYIGAFRYLLHAQDVLQEGYDKYAGKPFKVAYMTRWLVLVGNPEYVDELLNAPDKQLSATQAQAEQVQARYTLGMNLVDNPYHTPIIRSKLTRNVGFFIPNIRDEILAAFEEHLSPEGSEWKSVPAFETVLKIVGPTTNRILVGIPLCRDKEWVDLNVGFATDVFMTASIISMFPVALHPIVGNLLPGVSKAVRRGMKFLKPIYEERKMLIDECGKDHPDVPNDMITWLITQAPPEEQTLRHLTIRIFFLNFAAIHTTSVTFFQALGHLAAEPEKYLRSLREEIESVIEKEGWTRAAVSELHKVDSFLKESARIEGLGAVRLFRIAHAPFTFSDGTCIPPGTLIGACSAKIHRDSRHYSDGFNFDGFRFARNEGTTQPPSSLSLTAPNWLHFGHGKHACPARYFATAELKTMLAQLVLDYDIKLDETSPSLRTMWIGDINFPNSKARLMIRRRQFACT